MTAPSGPDFRLITESISSIVWASRPDGTVEYLNPGALAYAGLLTDGGHWDWWGIIHPHDLVRTRAAWNDAVAAPAPYRIDGRLRRHDGAYRWHTVHVAPVVDELGNVRSWIGTATDVDDAKRRESELRTAQRTAAETLELLEMLVSKAPVGFGLVDRDLRIVRVNEVLASISGFAAQEQIGRTVESVFPDLGR